MGTKGNAMWKEMLMGRVSSAVGLNAKCPVLLVK
jgi:nucleotide-binding universal stress UspA family protein